jgi:hypothetical protein
MTSWRDEWDRRLVQLRWKWQELTWGHLLLRVSAWLGIVLLIATGVWWWKTRSPSEPDLEALRVDLRSNDPNIRSRAYKLLADRDGAAKCFASALYDENVEIRLEAAQALADYPQSTAPATDALIYRLSDTNERVRGYCAIALGHAWERFEEANRALLYVMLDPKETADVKGAADWGHKLLHDGPSRGSGSKQSKGSSPP